MRSTKEDDTYIYVNGIGSSHDLNSTELLKIFCHISFSGSL